MKPARIAFYGNFGAGNLGNECTLQAVIEQTLERCPDAQLLCFCTNPEDVRARHGIGAMRSEVLGKQDGGKVRRVLRELAQWARTLRALAGTDTLIVAGTGIIADYMCGPSGWPYDIFRLSALAALCRVKLVFLSVGVGPIRHPLSRWFLKSSFKLAAFRSYRDEASRQYMKSIGYRTDRDDVYPDVVFGLARRNWTFAGEPREESGRDDAGPRTRNRVVGLGLKDYGATERIEAEEYRAYLELMADFVAWLHSQHYDVQLLIGDFQYDTRVVEEFVSVLEKRHVAAEPPRLRARPALSVPELLRQIASTDVVLSARYHNLVMSLIQDKPVLALSDHAKLDSLLVEFGLAGHRVPLEGLSLPVLIERFERLESDAESLKSYIRTRVEKYRRALDTQYALVLAGAGGESRPVPTL